MAGRRTSPFQRIRQGFRIRLQRLAARGQIPTHVQALREIISDHPQAIETVIFPRGLGWQAHLFQRPQQLARALARCGALIFYQEPELSAGTPGLQPVEERLYLCRVPSQTFQVLDNPLVSCMTWNRNFLAGFPPHRLHYDFVDDISAFDGSPARLKIDHQWLITHAQLVTATAERLHEAVKAARPDALLLPNGVDYDHFAASRQVPAPAPPPDLAAIAAQARPIIGYYGALSRWLDYPLLAGVAARRPGYSFVLIGPDFDGSLHPSGILNSPNVHWLGRKGYAELPGYLAHFAVATIPFKLEALTHATSPLKLFEYMAGGKPVVATPMAESMRFPGVLKAADAAEFAERLDEALTLREDQGYLSQIDRVAQENTWESRARTLLGHI